ncbi:MAG: 3-dehydroquinate synthase [Planctomycetes bacterium]|nr:3-dehydroquinate synthase [Planctomycetota bacterium]
MKPADKPATEPTHVPVSLNQRSYEVVIGERLLEQLRLFGESQKPTSVLLVTDSNVGPLHADAVQNAIVANHVLTVPAGENSKSLSQLGRLYDEAFATGHVDRQMLIVALGGGMVGDLGGFLAATLMRGVRFVHVPTSLLAMVDSSVGGKTAINHASGKNLIGAFHQPAAVFCDLHFLTTLPEREYVSALAEVVKTAVLSGEEFVAYLESNVEQVLRRDLQAVKHVVESCVRFKAGVVEEDETEMTGQRATLNFGHTLAHVVESLWPERYLHGEAVAIGIGAALRLSVERAKLNESAAKRVIRLLSSFGLPTEVPPELSEAEMFRVMAGDKKRVGRAIHFVVMSEIGQAGSLPCKLDDELGATLLGRGNA